MEPSMKLERHYQDRVHTEDLVLDIGEDAGALVLYTGPDLREAEVEVSLVGGSCRTHTQVHERVVNGRTIFAGVYPTLAPGRYRIWSDIPRPVVNVAIRAGEVVEVDWSPATGTQRRAPIEGDQAAGLS